MTTTRTVTRGAITAALATALSISITSTALAAPDRSGSSRTAAAQQPGDGWTGEGGLSLGPADNERVDDYASPTTLDYCSAQRRRQPLPFRANAARWPLRDERRVCAGRPADRSADCHRGPAHP